MVKLACINTNQQFLPGFRTTDFILDYYISTTEIDFKEYDGIIVYSFDNEEIIELVDSIPVSKHNYTYIIINYINSTIAQLVVDKKLKGFFGLEYGSEYIINRILIDYDVLFTNNFFEYKELLINYSLHQVTINKKKVNLTKKEYDLLKILVLNLNNVVSKEEIFLKIWDVDVLDDLRTLDTHLKTLRFKLKEYRSCIVTIWNKGYAFITQD